MSVCANREYVHILTCPLLWLLTCVTPISWGLADEPRSEPAVVEKHSRAFKISIDGTERGTLTMLLTKQDDGTEIMRGQAELSFDFFVYKYRYTSSGNETWKSGRLLRLANEADFNGDKYVVRAAAVQQDLSFQVNGKDHRTAADVWVTSYWREPDPQRIGQKLSLLDADKGRKLTGTLQRVGKEQLALEKKMVNATRYQIRGDVEVDLWYDEEQRLMRQHSLESGHRALLELTKITR